MRKMTEINIIVAVDEDGGFGKVGKIPWSIPEDLKHFKEVTKDSICIMGRRTYEDMVEMRKGKKIGKSILPGRDCFVLSHDGNSAFKGATTKTNLRVTIEDIPVDDKRKIFVIGGEKLFVEALSWANKVHLTIMNGHFHCDKFFPIRYLYKNFKIDSVDKKADMCFVTYIRS